MLIKEYRIPLPMTVDEYRIAQLYMIQVILMSDYYLVFCNRLGGTLLFRCLRDLAYHLHGLFGVAFVRCTVVKVKLMYTGLNTPTKDRKFFLPSDKLIYIYKAVVRSRMPFIVLNGVFLLWNALKNHASLEKNASLFRVHSWCISFRDSS